MDSTTPISLVFEEGENEEDNDEWEWVSIIRDYLDSKLDAMAAATRICDTLPDQVAARKEWSSSLYILWYYILDVAESIPHNHTGHVRFARLVTTLGLFTKTMHFSRDWTPAQPCMFPPLESLGWLMRDEFYPPYAFLPSQWIDMMDNPARARAFLNRTAFMAHMHVLHANDGLEIYCEWTFSDAFGRPEDVDAEPSTALVLAASAKAPIERRNWLTAAAALWIVYAGQAIFETFLVPRPSRQSAKRRSKWGTMEMWEIYRQRFELEAAAEELQEETRGLARRAASIMRVLAEAFAVES